MLAIVLMVKNEERTIVSTLTPFLDAGVQNYLVFDTGSTDKTVLVAHQLLKNAGVCYQLVQEEFIDFSVSRNRALALAEQMFPESTFLIMPDAEWIMQNVVQLLAFCEQEIYNDTPLYLIKIHMENIAFYGARLFRKSAEIRFVGAVHEVPSIVAVSKLPENVYFDVKSSYQGRQNSKARWTRDLALLLKEYQSDTLAPNPRTVFYLAQTYECLEQLDEASYFYALRAKLDGWDEETYMAILRLGFIAENQSKLNPNLFHWETAMQHYHHAFSLRPQRIEPLVQIAEHYWPDNIPLCYLYANYASGGAFLKCTQYQLNGGSFNNISGLLNLGDKGLNNSFQTDYSTVYYLGQNTNTTTLVFNDNDQSSFQGRTLQDGIVVICLGQNSVEGPMGSDVNGTKVEWG